MRTSLQLFKTAELPCDMFEYLLDSVARNANVSAAGGILHVGLRSDFTNSGVTGGVIGIVANPFGPEDVCANRHRQRDTGDVHVGIDPNIWWEHYGSGATDRLGVRAFVTGAGAIVFSNANWRIATVISTSCIYKMMMMMRYNVVGKFSKAARQEDPGCTVQGYAIKWCKIWQPELIRKCDPHLDSMEDGVTYHYGLCPTLAEIPTPQMG
jgi:hypothetical protein